MSDAAPEFGPAAFAAETGADAAAMARLAAYEAILRQTNAHTNLVSPGSLAELWRRHLLDSAQLVPLIPETTRSLIDIGSGAGLPGLVIAALRPALQVTLIESIEKKCAFLSAAAKAMGLTKVAVRRGRAEAVEGLTADVITARAVAPIGTLLGYLGGLTRKGTLCLFPKGRTAGDELTEARRSWRIEAELIPSRSDPSGSIVAITSFAFKGRRA
ncbi:MAG: 16S rRNA (guanine(527)-N(7))-methyltransferase RsmG [Alphaproteobacteria bacterium]|nr:16S rRNA (guanine(527)-N(7))-methyltransferase RsmG [Alphaproteobacteria bacterium]